ncbi:MAG TPA: hypothetical protein VE954_12560 [Oligoflexus sp.]|uniref:hypothetical protein n=1 Tax=Oligoflexus sp. TaxID=1971216 RepID=UPI002D2581B5|nr:hypothetical protein [Oligoflexus sp.]HYX33940.1 hypothetical protein [Oligoflexus sp.]
MKTREITDRNHVIWQCTQVFSGANPKLAGRAACLAKEDDGSLSIVCTPSGGEQTVRLQLKEDWYDQMSDDDLRKAIENAKESSDT